MHQNAYGSRNYPLKQYVNIIDGADFTQKFAEIDKTNVFSSFEKNFLKKKKSLDTISGNFNLSGTIYKYQYNVFVK